MELGKKGEGIKQTNKKPLTDTGNSMLITRGKGRGGEVQEGEEGINGDRMRHDFGW